MVATFAHLDATIFLSRRLASVAFGDEAYELDIRMTRGEPDKVGARIAGGAEHG